MLVTELINRTCVVTTPVAGEQDDFGLDAAPSPPVVVTTVCEIQQRRADEPGGGGETSDADWIGFFLPSISLRTSSKITVDGETYEVVGDPWRVRSPFEQAEDHIEAELRRTTGAGDEVGS